MSRHEGVSCDYCMKSNFRGRRYKCLICYDYDLCAECYESNATSTRHTTQHAVQCILTRAMIEVSYGSGSGVSPRQYQSFTCPYCNKKGYSETTLLEHVTAEHSESDSTMEVICPVCASSPGGEPNLKTDDLAEHLTLEHQRGGASTFEFINEPSGIRHGGVRRISRTSVGAGVRSARRSNNSSFSPSSNQEPGDQSVDLFAELQQTLAGGSRRQLQQLQMQIQMERQAIENRITNIGRRPVSSNISSSAANNSGTAGGSAPSNPNPASISIQRILSAMSNSGSGRGADSFMTSSPRTQLLSGITGPTITSINSTSASNGGGGGGQTSSFIPASSIQLQGLQQTLSSVTDSTVNNNGNNSGGNLQASNCTNAGGGQFLMPRFLTPTLSEDDREQLERDRSNRALYIQELLLGTVNEHSHNVIRDTPVATALVEVTTPDELAAAVAQVTMMDNDAEEQHAAQALPHHHHHHHSASGTEATAAAMKKSFIRKKEMTSVEEGGKKQKSKVSNTRK